MSRHFYLGDALGSVNALVDEDAKVRNEQLTNAWGEDLVLKQRVADRYGFTQRENDRESGLMHYRARSYDPRLGRFVQKDPAEFRSPLPREHYVYVDNNPASEVDPLGLQKLDARDLKASTFEFAKAAANFWQENWDWIVHEVKKLIDALPGNVVRYAGPNEGTWFPTGDPLKPFDFGWDHWPEMHRAGWYRGGFSRLTVQLKPSRIQDEQGTFMVTTSTTLIEVVGAGSLGQPGARVASEVAFAAISLLHELGHVAQRNPRGSWEPFLLAGERALKEIVNRYGKAFNVDNPLVKEIGSYFREDYIWETFPWYLAMKQGASLLPEARQTLHYGNQDKAAAVFIINANAPQFDWTQARPGIWPVGKGAKPVVYDHERYPDDSLTRFKF